MPMPSLSVGRNSGVDEVAWPRMTERRAACSCGQLNVIVEGDPVRISMCHCLACQRRTGSAFGMQARFPVERVRIDGRATEYVRISDEVSIHGVGPVSRADRRG